MGVPGPDAEQHRRGVPRRHGPLNASPAASFLTPKRHRPVLRVRPVRTDTFCMRRLLVVQTHVAVRFVISLLIAAGIAALLAVVFLVRSPAGWLEWIEPVRQTALGIGFPFLIAGATALALLPARRDLRRSAASTEDPDISVGSQLLLMGLAIGAAWQVPVLLGWWAESSRLIEQLVAGGTDPSGLWIIPATLVSAPPLLASLIIGLFIETSIGGAAARQPQAARLLRACVLLQGGLVIGSSLALPAIQQLVERIVALAAAGPDPSVVTAITNATTPQNVFATTLLFRFQLLFAGYVIAAAAAWTPGSPSPVEAAAQSGASLSVRLSTPAAIAAPASPAAVAVSPAVISLFNAPEYQVRLRTHWLMAAFRIGPLEYEIAPAGRTADDTRVSFSLPDGVLRRTSTGETLLTVKPESGGWSLNPVYVIAEPSGAVIGRLERDGRDWNVVDQNRRTIAQVEEVETRKGYFRYCMRANGTDVCRFTWAMHGLGVWTAAMDVEFAAAAPLPPVYAIALAPILEGKARRTSQWMN